tara:strand:- start:709 stop:900 length:192 start_codon:yes stop_codon:yes gene_type:complete
MNTIKNILDTINNAMTEIIIALGFIMLFAAPIIPSIAPGSMVIILALLIVFDILRDANTNKRG